MGERGESHPTNCGNFARRSYYKPILPITRSPNYFVLLYSLQLFILFQRHTKSSNNPQLQVLFRLLKNFFIGIVLFGQMLMSKTCKRGKTRGVIVGLVPAISIGMA